MANHGRLPDEEWLAQAKRVPVGEQRRIHHLRETSPALIVGNKDDRWWAYCQRCKRGAVQEKSHVLLVAKEPPKSRDLTLPYDMKLVGMLPLYQQDYLAKFLASKNMDMQYMPKETMWSEERQRLMVPSHFMCIDGPGHVAHWTVTQWMGRDTSGKSEQKWLTFNGQHYVGEANQPGLALLVEDMFSYLKIDWTIRTYAIPATVYCSLGTTIHDSLFMQLLSHHDRVASFYDGDLAGYHGGARNAVRLQAVGLAHSAFGKEQCAPWGLDPKDMTINQIRDHIGRLSE